MLRWMSVMTSPIKIFQRFNVPSLKAPVRVNVKTPTKAACGKPRIWNLHICNRKLGESIVNAEVLRKASPQILQSPTQKNHCQSKFQSIIPHKFNTLQHQSYLIIIIIYVSYIRIQIHVLKKNKRNVFAWITLNYNSLPIRMCLITNKCRRFFSTNQPRPFPRKKKRTDPFRNSPSPGVGLVPLQPRPKRKEDLEPKGLRSGERWRWMSVAVNFDRGNFGSDFLSQKSIESLGWNWMIVHLRSVWCSWPNKSPQKKWLIAEEVVFVQDDNYNEKNTSSKPFAGLSASFVFLQGNSACRWSFWHMFHQFGPGTPVTPRLPSSQLSRSSRLGFPV